jgi:7-cyano-7-deazaguanine synthase in queuosine biosynthesis
MFIRYSPVDELAREMVSSMPSWIFESSVTTFADPDMASASYLLAIKSKLELHGHDKYNIQNRLFGFCTSKIKQNNIKKRFGWAPIFIEERFLDTVKHFSAIIGNPPYQGKSALHQQFFNRAVELVCDGGVVCFIQPATPYMNKKDRKKAPEAKMIENVTKYETDVKFVDGCVFTSATIATDLSVTTMQKLISKDDNVNKITYKSGVSYSNVDIRNINMLQIEPMVYENIRKKYIRYINKNGSLHDIVDYKKEYIGAYIQQIRGHTNHADFYTIVGNNKEFERENTKKDGLSVIIDKRQYNNFYAYTKTHISRFGLALSKFTLNNHMGELRTVPLVPFDRYWSDEELAKLIGLSDQELQLIRSVLPDYHGILEELVDNQVEVV